MFVFVVIVAAVVDVGEVVCEDVLFAEDTATTDIHLFFHVIFSVKPRISFSRLCLIRSVCTELKTREACLTTTIFRCHDNTYPNPIPTHPFYNVMLL